MLLFQVTNSYTSNETSTTVKVTNEPPSLTGAIFSTNEIWMGDNLTVSASATDPGINDVLMYSFNFEGSWSDWSNSSDINYTYTNGGSQTLQVLTRDGDGGTSAMLTAELDIIVAMANSTAMVNDNDFAVTWSVISNQQYTIQRALTLMDPVWSNITAIIPAISNNITYIETNTLPKAFYRILLNP